MTFIEGLAGFVRAEAQSVNEAGSIESLTTLTPLKEIDPSAIKIQIGTTIVPATSMIVDLTGTIIEINFAIQNEPVVATLIAGHPGLTANNGLVCGGDIATG